MAKTDRLLANFGSEFVQIIVDKNAKTSKTTETKIETSEIPLVIQGYVVDVDDDMVYLGFIPELISQSVRRDYIIHIQITEENNDMEELILSGEIPPEGKDWN